MFCGWYWFGDIIPMNRRWRISISTIVLWLILIGRYHTHEQALTNIYKHYCFVADIDWEISYPWTQALTNIYKHFCFVADIDSEISCPWTQTLANIYKHYCFVTDIDSEISYPWTQTLANIYKHVCFINVYTTHYILQRIIVDLTIPLALYCVRSSDNV